MIRLTHHGAVFERDAALGDGQQDVRGAPPHGVAAFVEGSLLQRITRLLAEGEFIEREDIDKEGRIVAREATLRSKHPITRLFHLLLNNPPLFAAIQELVDCRGRRFPKPRAIAFAPRWGESRP